MNRSNRRDAMFSRRGFLGALGLGAASAFVPLLNASGEGSTGPKRVIFFFTPHGTIWDAWRPTGTETNFKLSRILTPLAKHQQKLVILDGVQVKVGSEGAGHTPANIHLLTGSILGHDQWNSHPSLDQEIAKVVGKETLLPLIYAGVEYGGHWQGSRLSFSSSEPGQGPDPMYPDNLYDLLFKSTPKDTLVERVSSLDLVKDELSALTPRIAKADQQKIEAHLDGVRSIELRLQKTVSCMAPALGSAVTAQENFEQNMDLVTSAMSCDLTRVALLQWTFADNDDAPGRYSHLGISEGHHSLSHEPDGNLDAHEKLIKINTYFAELFAKLLDRLDAVPEGDGTLLDNTVVVWMSELGTGNTHSGTPTPFVVAGGSGHGLKTGRYVKYPDPIHHHRLLVSLANYMGLTSMTKFGNQDFEENGSGPLPGLFT